MSERSVPAGEAVLVEGGEPGTQLFACATAPLSWCTRRSWSTSSPAARCSATRRCSPARRPEFTTRAARGFHPVLHSGRGRPGHPQQAATGVRFVARTLRDRLIQAARTMRALPDVRMRPVTSLLSGAPGVLRPRHDDRRRRPADGRRRTHGAPRDDARRSWDRHRRGPARQGSRVESVRRRAGEHHHVAAGPDGRRRRAGPGGERPR